MSSVNSIVIVRPEHLVSIKKRLAEDDGVFVVSESELIQIQDTLIERPPEIVIMHSAFATTSRGATLIAAFKAKPRETGTAVRVFIEDEVKTPMLVTERSLPPHEALLETSRSLDRAGTRQAARHIMNRRAVAVNGDAGQLIDLSISGAQVQSSVRLRPLKMLRLVLPEGSGDIRLQGTVAWAIAVPGGAGIQYRAGVQFVNPDQKALATFCERHGAATDQVSGKK